MFGIFAKLGVIDFGEFIDFLEVTSETKFCEML